MYYHGIYKDIKAFISQLARVHEDKSCSIILHPFLHPANIEYIIIQVLVRTHKRTHEMRMSAAFCAVVCFNQAAPSPDFRAQIDSAIISLCPIGYCCVG